MRKYAVHILSFMVLFGVIVTLSPFGTAQAVDQYRRWLDDKTYSCTTGSGVVYANLNNQNIEFNGLPADAEFTINYILNGVPSTDGPYTVEQTSGTRNYGSFAQVFPSYPFTFDFRLDTIIDGVVVYQSSLIINCTGDTASTPITPVNVELNSTPYRRWLNDKTYSCTTGSGVVYANLSNQNVEFNNLPVDAQFTLNYIDNGVTTTTSGPYTVEQSNGTRNYGAFAQPFPSYPFTFEFRIDTIIDGVVVYQSSLIINCTGDNASTPITPINVIPGSGGGASAIGCVASIPAGSVQGRLLETVTGLYDPDVGATTNVVLPIGTSWWIIDAEDGYYKLWIACLANPLWVSASSMGVNYENGGASLPDVG